MLILLLISFHLHNRTCRHLSYDSPCGIDASKAADVTPNATPPRLATDCIPLLIATLDEIVSVSISPGPAKFLIHLSDY